MLNLLFVLHCFVLYCYEFDELVFDLLVRIFVFSFSEASKIEV